MKLVFASDSFKGSLTSEETAALLSDAAEAVFGECECVSVPVADGGEGTCEAVIAACGGEWITKTVQGPLGEPVSPRYALLQDGSAVIEMSAASGLPLVPEDSRDPRRTSTYGTGELIRDALDHSCSRLAVAIGGSATNDGGMGCIRALGGRFLDMDGKELEGCGKDLESVRQIDLSGLDSRIRDVKLTVMCDVTNPLTGPNGATRVFGPQKGADLEMVEELEARMENYRNAIRASFGADPDGTSGAGAAGGLGTALIIFLGGEMRSGIETVLDLIGFDELLQGASLVVTGEGRTDGQSSFGKVLQGIGRHSRAAGVPAAALCGSLGPGYEALYDEGICSFMTTVDAPMALSEALDRAPELYRKAAVRLFRMIQIGTRI